MHISKTKQKTDQEIFDGLLQNDKGTFEFIYENYFAMVRKLVSEMGGQEADARDVFQEGVIALWQNARDGKFKLNDSAKLTTYLVQICKWRWLEKTKKASTLREKAMGEFFEQGEAPSVMVKWMEREEQMAFNTRFSQLGERCRGILKRFYFNNESMAHIASALNLTNATAKNEKYRCMQKLRKIFMEQKATPD